ncbi:MAG: YHS domain-containing protein [Chloroflexi bacterium]|nr:YHS domain-containing protein [Chloroflexota bacterium]
MQRDLIRARSTWLARWLLGGSHTDPDADELAAEGIPNATGKAVSSASWAESDGTPAATIDQATPLGEQQSVRDTAPRPSRGASAKDPVCGREVPRENNPYLLVCDGATYYFCSAGCRDRFEHAPSDVAGRYIGGSFADEQAPEKGDLFQAAPSTWDGSPKPE